MRFPYYVSCKAQCIMKIQLSDHFGVRTILRFTAPSILMMLFFSVYSVVDGLFVSNFAGKIAFASMSIDWPMFETLGAIGFMFGTGGCSIVTRRMGEGKEEEAQRSFSLFVWVTLLVGIVCAVIAQIFLPQLVLLLGADADTEKNAILYARISLCSLPFYIMQNFFQSFFSAAEKPKAGLFFMLFSGVLNMALDAVFVAGCSMGLAGASLGTAISEYAGGLGAILYFALIKTGRLHLSSPVRLVSESERKRRTGGFSNAGRLIGKAAANGSSEMLTELAMSLIVVLYNHQLLSYIGANGVAAFGVIQYVGFLFAAVFIGYSVGMAPVIGYQYGAGNDRELFGLRRRSYWMILCFGILMFGLSELLAPAIAWIFFSEDAALRTLTVGGLRIYAFSFLLCGFNIFGSSYFTAVGDGMTSALIAGMRTLVFQSAAVLLLPRFFGISGIWSAGIVAEGMSLILVAAVFHKKVSAKKPSDF